MSSKGENNKDPPAENNDKDAEKSEVKNDQTDDATTKENDEKVNEPMETDVKNGSSVKDELGDANKSSEDDKDGSIDEAKPKSELSEEEEVDEEEEEDGEEEEDDDASIESEKKDKKNAKKPTESTKSERKRGGKKDEDTSSNDTKETKIETPEGPGTPLGEIPRVDASISRFKNDDLKLLHQLIYDLPGKATVLKKNIKKFNGFALAKGSDEYNKKIANVQTFEVKQLKSICEMLDMEKKGSKDEIAQRIVEFLNHPKDTGKIDGGGRPKRTAAVRANNRGYSSHDDSYSSDEKPSRGRRDKGKRSNLKDESSNESDEDFQPSDASEEKAKPKQRRQSARRRQQSEELSDAEEDSLGSSEESNPEEKVKKRKVANNRGKGNVGRGRGRKPAQNNTTPGPKKRPGRGRGKKVSSESDDGDSSENEPLIKKAKNQDPPTDEEIKTYVKGILEGANLEEITMKTVCKQVYAHYPNFDLTHKKDYIKTTVKSLIST
nr:protein DEK [Onthophagus taurus]